MDLIDFFNTLELEELWNLVMEHELRTAKNS